MDLRFGSDCASEVEIVMLHDDVGCGLLGESARGFLIGLLRLVHIPVPAAQDRQDNDQKDQDLAARRMMTTKLHRRVRCFLSGARLFEFCAE